MTLVELAIKYYNGEITDEEAKDEYKKINVFIPKRADDELEEGEYSRGDGNSWAEIDEYAYGIGKEEEKAKFLESSDKLFDVVSD